MAADTNTAFLFSFFREPNGQAGLQLAASTNGLTWTEIKAPNGKSFIEPQVGGKLMRDPSLALGPDGTFHMVGRRAGAGRLCLVMRSRRI